MNPSKRYIFLPKRQRQLAGILIGGYVVLLINSLLLLLFDRSTALLYMSNVLLHVILGSILVPPVVVFLVLHIKKMPIRKNLRAAGVGTITAVSLIVLLVSGIALFWLGATIAGKLVLWTHIASVLTTIGAFVAHVSLKRGVRYRFLQWTEAFKAGGRQRWMHPLNLTMLAGLGLTVLFAVLPLFDRSDGFIQTADTDPLAQSQSILAHEGFLDDSDLSRSESCGQAGCHPDVYAQWSESAHRFSSFNNPWYRKSVEVMTERSGNEAARWCSSCHDPLILFTGRFEDDSTVEKDHWTSQEGLTCLSCHAVEGLRDVKGNGRYVISLPDEYPFARAHEGAGKWVHNKLVKAKPEPHRAAMLKATHKTQEFCGTCHKVSLPPEVNNYRWKRGQNQYDSWQSSGTSGNTVRSFYLPNEAKTCVDCHMPKVPSDDQGNEDGLILSHRFAAANTALPHLNQHPDQLEAVQKALADSIVTIDLFQASVNGVVFGPEDMLPTMQPGDRVSLDIVVRNRKVGHRFPAGTNDSNEIWVRLAGLDANGATRLVSGHVGASGRVDSTAHFFGATLVDRAHQEINKRNPQDWIATVFVNVINPGTARVIHYDFVVPPGAPIATLEAELNYRKFKWYFNEWTFRGEPAKDQEHLVSAAVDERTWRFNDSTAPELPITTMAQVARRADAPYPFTRPLWERWNDFGIASLLEGDFRQAHRAFEQVSTLAPDSPEGPLNQARAYLSEGQLDRADEMLQLAESRQPGFLKTAWFRGAWFRDNGLYEEALEQWTRVEEAYPEDRVLLLGIGRLHYLSGRYDEALAWFDRVLGVDPEDLGALYNRMLTVGALGHDAEFEKAQELYEYYKDDEDAFAVTAPFKKARPMANREAQLIHKHELHRPITTHTSASGGQRMSGG